MPVMRTRFLPVAIIALVAPAASAQQDVDRVLQFTSTDSPRNFAEIATAIRSTALILGVSVNAEEKTLALHGNPAQVALAEWLFTNLDKSPGQQAGQSQNWAKNEYLLSETGDDVVRLFYLANTQTVRSFQELVVAVRSVSDIRWMFTYNNIRAVAVRDTADKAKLAELLFAEMDKPLSEALPSAPSPEFRLNDPNDPKENLVRVFYLPNTKSEHEFQQAVTLARSITEIRRMFTYPAPHAVVARGTDDQIALAGWLLAELDRASVSPTQTDSGVHEYKSSTAVDDRVRVFYLPAGSTPQHLQEEAAQIRTRTGSRSVFTYNAPGAIAVRGSAEQIALADRVINAQ